MNNEAAGILSSTRRCGGALPFGRRYDNRVTSIEAYRMGMRAILEGAGPDGFLLGGHSPLWGSLGLLHAMRVTGDIVRTWPVIRSTAYECFNRSWQHGHLWINDPDCVVLENQVEQTGELEEAALTHVTPDEFSFHAAYIAASGGMVLSGDRIAHLSEHNRCCLQKLLQHRGKAACFEHRDFCLGRTDTENGQLVSVLIGMINRSRSQWLCPVRAMCSISSPMNRWDDMSDHSR